MNVVQYLLERRAEVTSSNNNAQTALHLCVLYNPNTELARLFLKHCAGMTAMDQNGDNALHMAVRRSYFEITAFF